MFGWQGGYRPTFNIHSALEREKAIERYQAGFLREEDEVDLDARNKLYPSVTTYVPPLKPKSEALKRLTAEQERVDHMKSEIRQAEHDLPEMKDIYEEASKTLTAMRQAYIDMPPE